MNSVLPITYVSPFDFAQPEAFVKLESEVCAFFSLYPEADKGKQAKLSQEEGDQAERSRIPDGGKRFAMRSRA